MSSTRGLLSVNALIGISLLIGFVSNVVIASVFGLTRAVDAYFAAMMLPNLFMILFVDFLGKNFLPVYAMARRKDEANASQLVSSIVTMVGISAALVAVVLGLFRHEVFGLLLPGFEPAEVDVVAGYFLVMTPAIVLMAVNTFHEYVCQYDERYVKITTIQLLLPLANLVAVIGLGPVLAERSLPFGYLVGHALVFLFMARLAGYRYRPTLRIRREWEGKIFVNSAMLMSSGVIARSRQLILNYFASALPNGAIAAMALTRKITSPMQDSATRGIRMIVFSKSAHMAAAQDKFAMGQLYNRTLVAVCLFILPGMVWLGVNREAVISLVFERGAFSGDMVQLVALALLGALPSVILLAINQILSNGFYAMDMVKVPALTMPLGTLIYIPIAALLTKEFGIFGLALSSAFSSGTIFTILIIVFGRQLDSFKVGMALASLARYTAVSFVAFGLPIWLLYRLELPTVLNVGLSMVIGVILYVAILGLTKDWGLRMMWERLRPLIPFFAEKS